MGAGRLGVSTAFFLGSRTFDGGGFGAWIGNGSGATAGRKLGLEVDNSRGVMGSTSRAGVLGRVTPDEMAGGRSDSDDIVMGLEGCAFETLEACRFVGSAVLVHSGGGLTGDGSSTWTGLEALQPVGRWSSFCRFGALSSNRWSSFSFSLRASYGDLIGTAFPTGPLGVPSKVFSDLCRSCEAARAAVFGTTEVGRWNGFTVAEGVGRDTAASFHGSFVFLAPMMGARSV